MTDVEVYIDLDGAFRPVGLLRRHASRREETVTFVKAGARGQRRSKLLTAMNFRMQPPIRLATASTNPSPWTPSRYPARLNINRPST